MSPAEMQARLDGSMAALADKPRSANPHPLGSGPSRAWSFGYREIMGEVARRSRQKPRGVLQ